MKNEDFCYGFEGTEGVTSYGPGGYHPTIMKDEIIGGVSRYRIMHKLGYGVHATVWLGLDAISERFVAIRISTARARARAEDETRLLQRAQGVRGVVALLESFTVHGPNGAHAVSVTEAVAPVLSFANGTCTPVWLKAVARGVADSVGQLHAAGVVHGSLHADHIGVSIPGFENSWPDVYNVIEELDIPEPIPVLPLSAEKQTPSLPAYVMPPCSLAEYYDYAVTFPQKSQRERPIIKIFRFCQVDGVEPDTLAPEFIAMSVATPSCDVWALGTFIYRLYTRSHLLANDIPSKSRTAAERDEFWAKHRELLRPACTDDDDTDRLVALLRRIFVLDPNARPTAAELLADPWFQSP